MAPNKTNMMAQFVKRVSKNLHCVVAMSPLGDQFRLRVRAFPALITCCTLDWYTPWPSEALVSVAELQVVLCFVV